MTGLLYLIGFLLVLMALECLCDIWACLHSLRLEGGGHTVETGKREDGSPTVSR